MKHSKMNFAGCELDVVIGHPCYELLFVGAQVAKAAGLNGQAVQNVQRRFKDEKGLTISELLTSATPEDRVSLVKSLVDPRGRRYHDGVWLLNDVIVYQMLLRGHAPQSEPFRKWVTEEVLPSIRKTGSYDIAKSETPEGLQFAEEFGKLRAEIGMLTSEVKGLREVIAELRASGPLVASKPSPYEGVKAVALHQAFEHKVFLAQGEIVGLSQTTLRSIAARAVVHAEGNLKRLWDAEDGRPLNRTTSTQGRDWAMFPETFLRAKLQNAFYREVALQVIDMVVAKN